LALREPARTPREARERYVRYLQRSLSCLSNGQWIVGRPPFPRSSDEELALTLSEDPLRLRRRSQEGAVLLKAAQRFEVVPDDRFEGEWKVATRGYLYDLAIEMPSGRVTRELASWHWHPPGRARPHLHVYAEHPIPGVSFRRLHLPTGRVAFEEIVRLLIDELDVRPDRDDWEAVLGEPEARFRLFRS